MYIYKSNENIFTSLNSSNQDSLLLYLTMFEALVERLLQKILGEYIQGFSSENLKIGIWSGEVIIKNVKLRRDIIKKLNLPFRIRYSRLGCLKMNIPWKSLTSSKIEVLLEGLEILVSEVPREQWDCKNTKIIEERKKEIESYCESVLADFAQKVEKSGKESEDGYFSQLVVKIIDNLQVTIRGIHIRYEDEISKQYSFGVTLDQLKVYTVNAKDQPEYVDRTKHQNANEPLRKRLQLHNVGVYWNESSSFFRQQEMEQLMGRTIAKRGQLKLQHNYIILMSSQAKLLQREAGKQFVKPQIDLGIDLNSLRIEITNNQLQQVISLGERLQAYSNEVRAQNREKLSQEQMCALRDQFLGYFPDYYNKKATEITIKRIEDILEKMQLLNLTPGIYKYLQIKEKQRIVKLKKDKSKGWFSGPKQLTPKQLKEIQDYLNDNFGKDIPIVKRPVDYYYINLNFKLTKLEIVIANTFADIKEGISTEFTDIIMFFKLREKGYKLDFSLQDIEVSLFHQIRSERKEIQSILHKVTGTKSKITQEYVRMSVIGNPLDKPYLNTQVNVAFEELIVFFNPQIIQVATTFAKIHLSKENTEAAIEKYGELKEKTSAAVNSQLAAPTKKQVGVDLLINTITICLPFDPKKKVQNCWGLIIGEVSMRTDEETLKRLEPLDDLPLDKFSFQLKDVTFRHFSHLKQLTDNQSTEDQIGSVLNRLSLEVGLQIYNKATQTIPKIKIIAVLPQFQVNLNSFTYQNIIKVGQCFQPQPDVQEYRMTAKATEKTDIMNKACKIGVVYTKDNLTQLWKKYIGVMSQNYIYLFADKKDKLYSSYYYIKNAQVDVSKAPLDKDKPFQLKIKNKINQVIFGFDREQHTDDWIQKIKAINQSIQQQSAIFERVSQSKHSQILKNPNQLNLTIEAKIKNIHINIFTTESLQNSVIRLGIKDISSQIYLYEAKKLINARLGSLQLSDSLYNYKKPTLKYFLETPRSQGDSLIDIEILQVAKDHPDYANVDSDIRASFGKLTCNYKCETVKSLMVFFLPKELSQQLPEVNEIEAVSMILSLVRDIVQDLEVFILKLNLKISQISLNLINEKTKSLLGKFSIVDFYLYNAISQKRMILTGNLKQLYYLDFTNYPYTIYDELAEYENGSYLLKTTVSDNRNMIDFDIHILKNLNQNRKSMLIKANISNLEVYYNQQPVFRILTCLTTQILPSLETKSEEKNKLPDKQTSKDTKPDPTVMELVVNLTDISVIIEPHLFNVAQEDREFLKLNIQLIEVRNYPTYRQYVKSKKPVILVENYDVKLLGMNIFMQFHDEKKIKRSYKITKNIDFTCSTDLIANPLYYANTYGNDFLDGIRVNCAMTPFILRINHEEYNFIMKCLNWNITFDDGVDLLLFDLPEGQVQKKQKSVKKLDFYLAVKMECISVFVTQDNLPIVFLLLNKMQYNMHISDTESDMDLVIGNLYGTAIQHKKEDKKLIERGLFNSLGYQKTYDIGQISENDSFLHLFDRRDNIRESQDIFLSFKLSSNLKKTSYIQITIGQVEVDVDIRILLILSNLAIIEQYTQPPQPLVPKIINNQPEAVSKSDGRVQIFLRLNRLLACISDSKKNRFLVLESKITFTMLNFGEKTEDELKQFFESHDSSRRVQHSEMRADLQNFALSFCNIRNGSLRNKRQILKPIKLFLDLNKYYNQKEGVNILVTKISSTISQIILEASIKDFLNINIIVEDNLSILIKFQKNKEEKDIIKENRLAIQQAKLNVESKIKLRTKLDAQIKPIQVLIVNDCDNNFMPILRFVMQQSKPSMDSFIIKTHFNIVPIFSLQFFNPRSSKWEPIVENFKTSVDFLSLVTPDGPTTKFMIEGVKDSLGQLKINLSTQLISSLIAAQQIGKREKNNMGIEQQKQQIEVSPYVIQNLTNQTIIINRRGRNSFNVPYLFKGPVRLDDQASFISFVISGNQHKMGLDHYGTLKIPGINYFIQFGTQKLNRVIRFLPVLIIKNCMEHKIYCKRKGGIKDATEVLEHAGYLPLDLVDSFQISLNGNSYTEFAYLRNISDLNNLMSENKKFMLTVCHIKKFNKYEVLEIRAPFLIRNCLPKSVHIQFIFKSKTISTKEIEAQKFHEVAANQDMKKMEYKLMVSGYIWAQKFSFSEAELGKQQKLELQDEQGAKTVLNYIFEFDNTTKQIILTIYCKKFIVSEVQDKLLIYGNSAEEERHKKSDRYQLIGGQRQTDDRFDEKIILIGDEVGNKIRVCGVHSVFDFATPINIGGVGSSKSRIVMDNERDGKWKSLFALIGVQIQVVRLNKQCDRFSKKIILKSKSIVVNSTNRDLTLIQQGSTNHQFKIKSKERRNFLFSLPENKQKVHGIIVQALNCYRSKPIYIAEQGTVFFRLVGRENEGRRGQQFYFKITTKQVDSYNFNQVEEISSKDSPYQIVVKSDRITVHVPHLNQKVVKGGEPCYFINEETLQQHVVILNITHQQSGSVLVVKVNPDNLNFRKKDLMKINHNGLIGNIVIEVFVRFSDKKKTIIVKQSSALDEVEKEPIEKSLIYVNLSKVVISINQNSDGVDWPYESLVLTLHRLCLISRQTDKTSAYQVKLGFMQLDQSEPYNISHPVVITPYKFEQFMREKQPRSIFNFMIVKNNEFTENTFINEISLDLDNLVVNFSADFLKLVIKVSKQFTEVLNFKEESYLIQKKVDQWEKIIVPKENKKTFIKAIRIAPFIIDLSAQLQLNKLDTATNQFFGTILSAVGVVVSNIDEAPISLDGIEISDCIDTVEGITTKLISHYKGICLNQLYKVVGSMNIIGNPMGLFRNISTGFKDLKEKPAKGFVNGPAEFGIGLAQGATSLIAHSVGGAFNSLSKVTGTISTGLATLTFDQQFQEHREKEKMRKPQNVIQGIEKGGKAVLYGFKQGVTGLFMQPWQNARREGALGFVKGVGKGLAGLVVKPVTGIIDFAAKTTEGIKNTAMIFQDKPNENRMRYPRCFYSECFVLKDYCQIDSTLYGILRKPSNESKFEHSIFVESFVATNGTHYLVILQQQVVYIDVPHNKVVWALSIRETQCSDVKDKKLIIFKDNRKATFRVTYLLYSPINKNAEWRMIRLGNKQLIWYTICGGNQIKTFDHIHSILIIQTIILMKFHTFATSQWSKEKYSEEKIFQFTGNEKHIRIIEKIRYSYDEEILKKCFILDEQLSVIEHEKSLINYKSNIQNLEKGTEQGCEQRKGKIDYYIQDSQKHRKVLFTKRYLKYMQINDFHVGREHWGRSQGSLRIACDLISRLHCRIQFNLNQNQQIMTQKEGQIRNIIADTFFPWRKLSRQIWQKIFSYIRNRPSYYLTDCKSRNGTFVLQQNGRQVKMQEEYGYEFQKEQYTIKVKTILRGDNQRLANQIESLESEKEDLSSLNTTNLFLVYGKPCSPDQIRLGDESYHGIKLQIDHSNERRTYYWIITGEETRSFYIGPSQEIPVHYNSEQETYTVKNGKITFRDGFWSISPVHPSQKLWLKLPSNKNYQLQTQKCYTLRLGSIHILEVEFFHF